MVSPPSNLFLVILNPFCTNTILAFGDTCGPHHRMFLTHKTKYAGLRRKAFFFSIIVIKIIKYMCDVIMHVLPYEHAQQREQLASHHRNLEEMRRPHHLSPYLQRLYYARKHVGFLLVTKSQVLLSPLCFVSFIPHGREPHISFRDE